jgi:hypothetical protein
MSNLYLPKNLIRTRDEFSGPDRFFNLTRYIDSLSAATQDLTALQDSLEAYVETTVDAAINNTVSSITNTVNVPVVPHTTSVAATQTGCFIVPAALAGKSLIEVHIRHGVASAGATGNTSVQVLKGSTDLIDGDFALIPAQALVPSGSIVLDSNTVTTGDPIFVYVAAIPAGGTAPTGLYATLVFGEV